MQAKLQEKFCFGLFNQGRVEARRKGYDKLFFNGSNMVCGVDAGVLSDKHGVGFELQAQHSHSDRNQAIIKALYSIAASSNLVQQCTDALNRLGDTFKNIFLCVLGHRGTERMGGLTRRGSALDSLAPNHLRLLPNCRK